MEFVIGLLGVGIGGGLTLLGGHIQSKHADRRLKIQLEHDVVQREQDRIRAIDNESIEYLGTLIKLTTEIMPRFMFRGDGEPKIDPETLDPVLAALSRAGVSMRSRDAKNLIPELDGLKDALGDVFSSQDPDGALKLAPNVNIALINLDKRYRELKLNGFPQK